MESTFCEEGTHS